MWPRVAGAPRSTYGLSPSWPPVWPRTRFGPTSRLPVRRPSWPSASPKRTVPPSGGGTRPTRGGRRSPDGLARSLPEPLRTEVGAETDVARLRRALDDLAGGAIEEDLAAVASFARETGAPVRAAARALELRAQAAADAVATTLRELEAEHAALESEEEVRPPRSRFRDAERDPNAGAGFYELVEVAAGLEPNAVAGLEAALEASGLLDAWVSAEGLVLHR